MVRLLFVLLPLLLLTGCVGVVAVGAVGGVVMANDERSISTQLNDTDLDYDIEAVLNKDKDIRDYANISVVTVNGKVLLLGQAPNTILRDKIVKTVYDLKVASTIHDQIRIGNPISFTTRSNDTWITTKVKSRMLNEKELDITRIKVVTENGEVFLLGLISQKHADIAVDVARNTAGVRKVIKVFEIVQS